MNIRFFMNLLCLLFLSTNVFAVTATLTPPPLASNSVPKININKADSKTLTHSINGIGPKRAEAIVKYRDENKGFKSLDELAKVPGLGAKFIAKHNEEIQSLFNLG